MRSATYSNLSKWIEVVRYAIEAYEDMPGTPRTNTVSVKYSLSIIRRMGLGWGNGSVSEVLAM